jgi:hypothetical protein
MKYRHCDGKLVLKVTDNKEVLIGFSLSWHVQICAYIIYEFAIVYI